MRALIYLVVCAVSSPSSLLACFHAGAWSSYTVSERSRSRPLYTAPVEPSHFCFPATDIQWVLPSTLHPATLSSGRLLVERSPHQRPGASSCRDSALMAFRVQVRFLATIVEAAAIGHRTGATMHRCGVKVVRVSPCLLQVCTAMHASRNTCNIP